MCRLMFLPRDVRPPRDVLLTWMQTLSASLGGDGLGYATPKAVVKGVKLTEKQCAEEISSHKLPVVWHTRLVSCGEKTDELCHPFPAGNGFLVHNGHWAQGAFAAGLIKGGYSDTAVAALAISLKGWQYFTKECFSGVWIRLTRKGRQVLYASGSLYVETETGALCSEPCADWGVWKRADEGIYGYRQEVKTAKDIAYSYSVKGVYLPKDTKFQSYDDYGAYLKRWKGTV